VKKENKKIEGGEITQKPVFQPLPGEKFGHSAPGQPFRITSPGLLTMHASEAILNSRGEENN